MTQRAELLQTAARARLNVTRLLPALLALLAFGLAFFSLLHSQEGSDPRGTLFISQLLLRTGDVRLDNYPEMVEALTYRVVLHRGHWQVNFPLGTSFLATPFVAVANLLGMDMASFDDDGAMQNLLSALSLAGALLLCYAIGRIWLGPLAAVALAGATVFSTGMISTMGVALWSTNTAVLLILGALLLLLRPPAGDSIGRGALIGLLLALAYLCRPTSVSFIVPLLIYCLLLRRRTALGMILGAAGPLLLFVAYSQSLLGQPLPPYYEANRLSAARPLMLAIALAGHLISPGRGLLVWNPHLLLVLAGALALLPRLRREPLYWLALAWLGFHLLMIASFPHWWGGISFGNRLVVDAMPATLLLAALAWRAAGPSLGLRARRAVLVAFFGLAALGALIHVGNGLYRRSSLDWNFWQGHSVDTFPMMLFDWRYPQLIADTPMLQRRAADYRRAPLAPNELFDRPVFPVWQLRYNPSWTPEGIVLDGSLAALLDHNWYEYEPGWNVRWMRGVGRIWLASNAPTPAKLRLLAAGMNDGGRLGEHGELRIFLDGAPVWSGPIQAGVPIEVPLQLPAGAGELRLELAAGAAELAPGDPRELGVAFRTIEVRTAP